MPQMPEERQDSEFANAGAAEKPAAPPLPEKLLLELSAAQESFRLQGAGTVDEAGFEPSVSRETQAASPLKRPVPSGAAKPPSPAAGAAGSEAGRTLDIARSVAHTGFATLRRFRRRMRFDDWRRRYLAVLSLAHRHMFDRNMERLLFFKTVYPERYSQDLAGGVKAFLYQGPLPGKVVNWSLSVLPSDLKRYAFVDFRAGNGRTLLLAARRNFEHATGYAFDERTCEVLEMNLAQYSRSYMSCRDVRALRADRDGVAIPPQPAVLFFPHDLAAKHLGVILDHVSESVAAHPRPVYLVFEHIDPAHAMGRMQDFEKVSLPPLNRIKIALFSPVLISVYKSAYTLSGV